MRLSLFTLSLLTAHIDSTILNCDPLLVGVTTLSLNGFPLNSPQGIYIDASGLLFVADKLNHVIRAINLTSNTFNPGVWNVTSARAMGYAQGLYASASGATPVARLSSPEGVTGNPLNGDIYAADTGNCAIIILRAYSNNVTSYPLVGSNSLCGTTDGIGTSAAFSYPLGLAFSSSTGILYVTDKTANVVRAVVVATRNVTTLAGSGAGGGVDGIGTNAKFYYPLHPALDVARLRLVFGGKVSFFCFAPPFVCFKAVCFFLYSP